MAQIDSSIYLNQPVADIFGSFQKGYQNGLSVRDMLDKKAKAQKQDEKDQNLQKAYNAGIVKNPDGSVSYDGNKTASELAGLGYGKEAYEAQNQFKQQKQVDLKTKQEQSQIQNEMVARVGQDVLKNPSLWPSVRNSMISQGFATENDLPSVYDENFVKNRVGMALTNLQQLDQQFKEKQFSAEQVDKKEGRNIQREELGIKRTEALKKANSGESLPLDAKKQVETLATKNANKIAIKNQIDATMENWDQLPDDQKLAVGRTLLKTLNSSEGADAIGVEEANRLGSKLEFAMGNLTNSNSMQFGRDLKGFKDQAQTLSGNIGSAVESNQAVIDKSMGRPLQGKPTDKPGSSKKPSWAL